MFGDDSDGVSVIFVIYIIDDRFSERWLSWLSRPEPEASLWERILPRKGVPSGRGRDPFGKSARLLSGYTVTSCIEGSPRFQRDSAAFCGVQSRHRPRILRDSRREIPPSPHMYFVYVLQSRKDNGYYIGYTADLDQRLKEHNSRKTRSLRHRLPLDLIYLEEFKSKRDAKARECQIKSWKGGESFKRLIEGSRAFGGVPPRRAPGRICHRRPEELYSLILLYN